MNNETTFQYEVLIHDDASTDGTTDIIKEYADRYPKIIKPLLQKENQFSKGVKITYTYQMPRAKGKFIAFCEGDDYWIDENKLQNQVDFLMAHPDYGLVYSKCYQFYEPKQMFYKKKLGVQSNFNDLLINGNSIPTNTVLLYKDDYLLYYDTIVPKDRRWKMGDYPLWLYISTKKKIYCLDKCMSVYRILSKSASHSSDYNKVYQFEKNTYEIRKFFSDKYNVAIEEYDDNFTLFHAIFITSKNNYTKQMLKKCRDNYRRSKNQILRWKLLYLTTFSRISFYIACKYYDYHFTGGLVHSAEG